MTLEQLNKRIETTQDLRNIVSTMKMLSSVSVTQYAKAHDGILHYRHILSDGFQALHLNGYLSGKIAQPIENAKTLVVLIGSDNGLVGSFNKNIIKSAERQLKSVPKENRFYICLGRKICAIAQYAGIKTEYTFPISNTIEEIADIASQLLIHIQEVKAKYKIERVLIFYNKKTNQGAKVQSEQLFPFSETVFQKNKKWQGKGYPLIDMDYKDLFVSLIHEYITTMISGAVISSLACEHYMRMINMQQAEKNIDEKLEEMNLIYAQNRQTEITDELIDIISGANSLTQKKKVTK